MAARGWERDGDLARSDADTANSAQVNDSTGAQDGGEDIGSAVAATTTRKRRRNLLSEDKLVSAEGLRKVYRTFPYQVSSDVTGRESQALASLVKMYKQWAFDLYPGLNFEDFVARTETLGKGHQVQGLMAELRDKERRKTIREDRESEEKEEEVTRELSDDDGEEAML
ncbi:hypothetical protein PHYBOEH_009629 [Phytophthora boehmeriae]|uniref:Chromosome segregation in meiosis protein 3 domain-containing protein n=1 Tax=Phytophthora boehmeriae TaxID=109152 RepID=A0A8T1VS11_9STRA|nr:hypothetical protein PHYBOEH_009629 [Phytophthora boehmeriae]